jgi:hypothetical protein
VVAATLAAVAASTSVACSGGSPDEGAFDDRGFGHDGGGGTPDDAAASGSADPTSACRTNIEAQCAKRAECYGEGAPQADCLAYRELCPDVFIAPGSTRTPTTLLACLDGLKNMSCDDYTAGIDSPCATLGTLPQGAPCLTFAQCQSLACNKPSPSACGACKGIFPSGHDCTRGGDELVCPQNQRCDVAQKICVPIVAYQHIAAGGACPAHDDGGDALLPCKLGLGCILPSPSAASGTCAPLPGPGAPCALTANSTVAHCNHDAWCKFAPATNPSLVDKAGTCMPLATAGDACGWAGTTTRYFIECDDATYCKLNAKGSGTCMPRVATGQPCGARSAGTGLNYSIECAEGSCETPPGADAGNICYAPATGTKGAKCAAPGSICAEVLDCVNGVCTGLPTACN